MKKVKERVDWVKYWEKVNRKKWRAPNSNIKSLASMLDRIRGLSIQMIYVIIESTFEILDRICEFIIIFVIVIVMILILLPIAKAF